jgi:hypothetical protein
MIFCLGFLATLNPTIVVDRCDLNVAVYERDRMNIEELDNHRTTLKNSYRSGVTKSYEWRLHELNRLKNFLVNCENEILDALKADLGRCQLEAWSMDYAGTLNEVDMMIKNLKLSSHSFSSFYFFRPLGNGWNHNMKVLLF